MQAWRARSQSSNECFGGFDTYVNVECEGTSPQAPPPPPYPPRPPQAPPPPPHWPPLGPPPPPHSSTHTTHSSPPDFRIPVGRRRAISAQVRRNSPDRPQPPTSLQASSPPSSGSRSSASSRCSAARASTSRLRSASAMPTRASALRRPLTRSSRRRSASPRGRAAPSWASPRARCTSAAARRRAARAWQRAKPPNSTAGCRASAALVKAVAVAQQARRRAQRPAVGRWLAMSDPPSRRNDRDRRRKALVPPSRPPRSCWYFAHPSATPAAALAAFGDTPSP